MDILIVAITLLTILAWFIIYYQRLLILAQKDKIKIKDEKIKQLEVGKDLDQTILNMRDDIISNYKQQVARYKEMAMDWQTIDSNNNVIIAGLKTELEAVKNNESTGP